jgi:hypothetical protein
MKNFLFINLILCLLVFSACEQDEFYRPQTGGKPERVPLPTVNITSSNLYSVANLANNPVFTFTLDFDIKENIASVDVLKRYRFINDGLTAFVTRPSTVQANLNTFPITVSIPINDMIVGMNNRANTAALQINELRPPTAATGPAGPAGTALDFFEITFQIRYKDGRILTYEAPFVDRNGVYQGRTILTIPIRE